MQGLVAYLPFLEQYGSTVRSPMGRALDGTCVSMPASPTWSETATGLRMLDFDGTNDRVSIALPRPIQTGQGLTMMVWARPDTLGGSSSGVGMSLNTANGATNRAVMTVINSSGNKWRGWANRATTNAQSVLNNTGVYSTTAPKLICMTWDGQFGTSYPQWCAATETGFPQRYGITGGSLGSGTPGADAQNVQIGSYQNGSAAFDGNLGGFAGVWTRVLTHAEIVEMWADPYAPMRPPFWQFPSYLPYVVPPAQTIDLTGNGIASSAAVGSPGVFHGQLIDLTGQGIASTSAIGTPGVAPGPVTIDLAGQGIASTAALGSPDVSQLAYRDLDGTDDTFSGTGTAVTGSWSWVGHVVLDTAGGYLFHTATSGGTRCQSVSVESNGGKNRLTAYQNRATTPAQCVWELPIPLSTDVTLAVYYDSSTGRFRAWAGTADIPATELQWRYSQTLGSGSSTASGSTWSVSPSTSRVNGRTAWQAFTSDQLSVAEIDLVRRYGSPPVDGNLLGWWKHDEVSGNAADSSGNSRTLTASGSPGTVGRTPPPAAESSNSITLTGVPDWRIYQRNSSDQATITLAGTCTTGASVVEARHTHFGATPGAWTTVDAAPTTSYSGTFTMSTGQGTLEVRANYSGVYAYVRRHAVGCGDIYFVVGTSNASGVQLNDGYTRVESTLTTYEFGQPVPALMSNRKTAALTHEWVEIHDPVDAYSAQSTDLPSRTNSIFGGSSGWVQADNGADATTDTTSTGAGKSVWPQVAALILEHQAVPVAIAPCPRGQSNLATWVRTVATYWPEFRARNEELAGVSVSDTTPLDGTHAKAVLAVMGENDYGTNPAVSHYADDNTVNGSVKSWGQNDIYVNTGLPVHLMVVGDWPGTSAYNYTNAPADGITSVRTANLAAWSETGILPGPHTYELDLADEGGDGFHYKTAAELDTLAKRWYAVLVEAWYGGATDCGRGPRVQTCQRSGANVVVKFDVDLDDPGGGGYTGIQVYVGTSSTPANKVTPSSMVRDSSDHSKVNITLASNPGSSDVWVGCGEYDYSAGKTVPTVTRTVGGVSVTLPAEVFTGRWAAPSQDINLAGQGIASSGAVGTPQVSPAQTIDLAGHGIAVPATVGAPALTTGPVTVDLTGHGIASTAAVGDPNLYRGTDFHWDSTDVKSAAAAKPGRRARPSTKSKYRAGRKRR